MIRNKHIKTILVGVASSIILVSLYFCIHRYIRRNLQCKKEGFSNRLRLLTVATHEEGYFPALIESSRRNGIDIEVLGLRQNWNGFIWKYTLVMEALKEIPNEQIVCFVDAFDVILLGGIDEIIEKFKATGKEIIYAHENFCHSKESLICKNALSSIFGDYKTCLSNGKGLPNSGTYIGYARMMKDLLPKLLEISRRDNISDDQVVLAKYFCQNDDKRIGVDTEFSLFYCAVPENLDSAMVKSLFKINFHDELPLTTKYYYWDNTRSRLVIRDSGNSPCILHLNGNLNGNAFVRMLSLPQYIPRKSAYPQDYKMIMKSWLINNMMTTIISVIIIIIICIYIAS